MRKKILIAGLIISSLVFAQELKEKNKANSKGPGMEMPMDQVNLSDAQKKEIQTIISKNQKEIEGLRLSMQEKEILIKKELLTEKINWIKVENLTKEKNLIESQMEISRLKTMAEVKEKFGIQFGFGKNFEQNGNNDMQNNNNKNNDMKKMDGQGPNMKKSMDNGEFQIENGSDDKKENSVNCLTELQQKDIKTVQDKYKKQIDTLKISKEEKELAMKKELIAEKINWVEVEKLTKEKSDIEGQLEFTLLQEKEEIKAKIGFEFMSMRFENNEMPKNMEKKNFKM